MLKSKTMALFLLFVFAFTLGLLQTGVLLAEEGEEAEEPVVIYPPSIETVFPNYGHAGDIITIAGNYLNDIDKITIGNKVVEKDSVDWIEPDADGKSIGLKIPEGLSGVVDIVISKGSRSAVLENAFTLSEDKDPKINSISPNSGGLKGGTLVTIRGENFKQGTGSDGQPLSPEVRFGTIKATGVRVLNTREIVVISPEAIDEGKQPVTVKNHFSDAAWVPGEEEEQFYFEYINEGKLARILNITPNSSPMSGGTEISIQGVNFPADLQEADVDIKIGGVSVVAGSIKITLYGYTEESQDGESKPIYMITAVTEQSNVFGYQDVALLIEWKTGEKAGRSEIYILEDGFNYYYPSSNPIITEVVNEVTKDSVGPVGGEHTIHIKGTDFRSGAKVFFGEKEAEIIGSITPYLIKVKLPASDFSGNVNVLVINYQDIYPTGQYVLDKGFTYKRTSMEISSVTPREVLTVGRKYFTITGQNFHEDIERLTDVYFEIRKEDPDDPENIIIDQEPLRIYDFNPNGDGTLMVAESNETSSSGRKYLVIENSYGRVISKETILFYPPDIKPEIYTVTEAVYEGDKPLSPRGPITGGTRFIITGDYLTSGSKVFIGDVEAEVDERRSDFKRMEVISKTGTPGWKDVKVVSPTGNMAIMEADPDDETAEEGKRGFYYYSEPKITNVSPERGSSLGGNIITITGEQFYLGAEIDLGYLDSGGEFISVIEAVNESIVINEKNIKFRLPELKEEVELIGGQGDFLVKVTNIDGQTAVWAKKFRIRKPELNVLIHSVNPSMGHVDGGTKVIIRGENFQPGSVVHFGWERAEVQSYKSNELVVITPPNLAGKYKVTVSNYPDTSTAVWDGEFEYVAPETFPKISGIFPDRGPATGKTRVVITGVGFWPTGIKVFIDGKPAEIIEADYEYLVIETPASDKRGSVDVTVINSDGGSSTVPEGYTYEFPDSQPKIISAEPNKIPATGGTVVVIKGEDFRKNLTVYFGNEIAEILEFIEPEMIIVKAPPYTLGEEGIVDITVLNRDGGIAQLIEGMQYFIAKSDPVIDNITPVRGPAEGGTKVIIGGDGFSSKGIEVYFGGRKAEVLAGYTYDRLEVITPPGEPGSVVHVTVMNTHEDALGSATAYNAYTYDASKPVITSIAPDQATYLGNTLITIRGSGFTEKGAEVFIGKWQGQEVRVIDSGTITFVTPGVSLEELGELKWWDVKVINADGIEAVKEKAFRYLFPDSNPEIIFIDPLEGSTQGGMPLTIIGTDFRLKAKVVIGGKEAEILSIDDSPGEGNAKIIVKTPPHSPGEKGVTVINYEGAISNTVNFTYRDPLSFPEILNVEPKQGPTLGDTEVYITGIGFKEGARVWFGTSEAQEVEFIDYKTLKVLTSPGNEGSVDVLVLNEDMGQAVLAKGFRYVKAKEFVVSSITPNEGSALGGTAITIKGGPFETGVLVYIGAELALEVIRPDAETIFAVTPQGDLGWQEVKVKNPDGGFVVIENGFFYFKPRTAPDTPDWIDTVRKDRDTIEVSWEPAEFANYYEIWVSNSRNGKYVFLDQTTKTVYYATSLDLSSTYYFQIRAINELGVSGFSYYSYARTGVGSEKEADLIPKEVVIQATKEVATAIIATRNNLLSTAYRIDFTKDEYKSAVKKIVKISQDALSGLNWPITIELPDLQVSVPPVGLLLELWGQSESYAELTLMDLGQQEAEKALKSLPKGSRILSSVFSIEWQVLQETRKTPQSKFYQPLNLTFKYNSSLTTGKEISLFTYNATTGKWVNTGAAPDSIASLVKVGIQNTGRFVLVEH